MPQKKKTEAEKKLDKLLHNHPGYARDRYTRTPITFLDEDPPLNVWGFTVGRKEPFATDEENLVLGKDPLRQLAYEPNMPRVYVKGGRHKEPRGEQTRQHEMVHAIQGLMDKKGGNANAFNAALYKRHLPLAFHRAEDEWDLTSQREYGQRGTLTEMAAKLLSGEWAPKEGNAGTAAEMGAVYLAAIREVHGKQAADAMKRYAEPDIQTEYQTEYEGESWIDTALERLRKVVR